MCYILNLLKPFIQSSLCEEHTAISVDSQLKILLASESPFTFIVWKIAALTFSLNVNKINQIKMELKRQKKSYGFKYYEGENILKLFLGELSL